MTKEEKMIAAMRQERRWSFIVMLALLLLFMLGALAYAVHREQKLDASVTPENVRELASFDNPKAELPELFCRFYKLAGYHVKLHFSVMFIAMITGLCVGMLIIQIADISSRRLFISMWDRIQRLETEIKELRTSQNGKATKPPEPTAHPR
jgi:hypothetical protein